MSVEQKINSRDTVSDVLDFFDYHKENANIHQYIVTPLLNSRQSIAVKLL